MRLLSLFASLLLPLLMVAQRIEYRWLNTPCTSLLNCDTGCTACNMATNTDASFTAGNAGFIGVDVCPHPISSGDNLLFTYGWPAAPDEQHMVVLSGIAWEPVHIDSLIIEHRSSPGGPERLRVRYGINESMPANILADVPTPTAMGSSVWADLGTVAAGPEMVYGYFSLILQPYQGGSGSWDLDGLRIVGSPATMTGIPDLSVPTGARPLPRYDALGRPIVERRALRFYLDRSKRVMLQ